MILSSRSVSPISVCFTSKSISFRPLAQSHAVARKHARPAGTLKQLDAQPPVPKRQSNEKALAARFLSALRARAGTRKRASPPRALCPATSWRSPQTSSTGTVPKQAAGSATLPSNSLARSAPMNGSSPSPKRHTTHWKRKSASRMRERSLSFLVHMRVPSL